MKAFFLNLSAPVNSQVNSYQIQYYIWISYTERKAPKSFLAYRNEMYGARIDVGVFAFFVQKFMLTTFVCVDLANNSFQS